MQTPRKILPALFLLTCGFANQAEGQAPDPGKTSREEFEVVETLDVKIPLRDGVNLAADIFRPKSDQKFPAILQQTPYGKTGQRARAKKFAALGYVVVNTESRGRFESGGEWDPFSAMHKTDGYDAVEWVARQDWSPNGKIYARAIGGV